MLISVEGNVRVARRNDLASCRRDRESEVVAIGVESDR
jgi:hypothetical protein